MRPERAAIERWLREDLGHHDVVNDLPGTATGRIVAKEDGVAAGVEAATRVFEYLGVEAEATIESGETVDSGEPVLRVCGPTEQVLRGERVGVNLLGHASGIATKTRRAVEAVEAVDDSVRVAATRKTTPGLRGIEKRAVAAGGGDTHRLDLSHAAMIKDNHVARLGLKEAVERVRDRASFTTMIEVESETMEEAVRAAELGADIVLLDNMSKTETAEAVDAVRAIDEQILTEASGGITVPDAAEYAEVGVDVVSIGGLTHSAPALDVSCYVE